MSTLRDYAAKRETHGPSSYDRLQATPVKKTGIEELMKLLDRRKDDPHIKPWMEASFAELTHASQTDAPFALVPCFVDGQPSATIAITKDEGDSLHVMPLFVAITPSMRVRSPDTTR